MAIATGPTETAVIHYAVKDDDLDEHLALLCDVYAELDSAKPVHFSWSTYRIDGTREFVEATTGRPLPGPLMQLASFRHFRAGLDDRCEARRFEMASLIGSYSEQLRV